jgi:hypothetical protein
MTKILGSAFKALVGSGTAVALVLGSGGITGTAYAADFGGNSNFYESGSVAMSEADVAKLAEDLETLFTKYIPQVDGKYVVNEDAIIADGYADQLEDFRTVVATFNDTSNRSDAVFSAGLEESRGVATTNSAGSYAKCVVLGALGIPATAFTYGTWTAITTAISAWNWGLAASTIARALGPALVGGFGKAIGGPAVIAAALAVAAVSCTLTL